MADLVHVMTRALERCQQASQPGYFWEPSQTFVQSLDSADAVLREACIFAAMLRSTVWPNRCSKIVTEEFANERIQELLLAYYVAGGHRTSWLGQLEPKIGKNELARVLLRVVQTASEGSEGFMAGMRELLLRVSLAAVQELFPDLRSTRGDGVIPVRAS
jgi:hypothetical protein